MPQILLFRCADLQVRINGEGKERFKKLAGKHVLICPNHSYRHDPEVMMVGDHQSEAQLGRWGAGFNEGVDRMRRLVCEYYAGFSFGAFVRKYPHLRNTVTDLLIGDLFNTRVDAVWQPMETLQPAGKKPIPSWDAGTPMEELKEKSPYLVLPEGPTR